MISSLEKFNILISKLKPSLCESIVLAVLLKKYTFKKVKH